MVKLAIADALGFDVTTQTGGPDGSVVLEMDRYRLQLHFRVIDLSNLFVHF